MPAGAQRAGFGRVRSPQSVTNALLINVALSSAIGGARARVSGRKGQPAMFGGALGGLVHAVGKVAATSKPTLFARFGGTALGSLGTSMVRNASDGNALLSVITIPIGPLRFHFDSVHRRPRVGVNVYEGASLGFLFFQKDLRVNVAKSLASATFVFDGSQWKLPDERALPINGATQGGSVVLTDLAPNRTMTFKHELAHVMQQRFVEGVIGHTIDEGLVKVLHLPLPRWVELGVGAPLISIVDWSIGQKTDWKFSLRSLKEREARTLSR